MNKIPIGDWVHGTIGKMLRQRAEDRENWNKGWLKVYEELGGLKPSVGKKPCPRAAAYALWMLGYIKDGGRPFVPLDVDAVRVAYGKNAAYAVIAVNLWKRGAAPSPDETWPLVKRIFAEKTGMSAAESEQGEVKLAMALCAEGHLTS